MIQTRETAQRMARILPTFLRHMFPYVFGSMDLPPSQVLALVTVEEHAPCPLTRLRQEMHVSAPTVTGIVDRLERGGYVRRVPHPTDRRVTNLVLTPKGQRVVQRFRNNIQNRWETILARLPADMQNIPLQLLQKIVQGFSDENA